MIRVGQLFLEEREKHGLSLDEVAKATKIKASFLSAIEKGEYRKLPSSAYIQGFVKNYADFLGLPKRETMALFRREFSEKELLGVLPEGFTKQENIPLGRWKITQRAIIVGLLFLALFGYLFYQYRLALFSPSLSVSSPKENQTVTSQEVVVKGDTDQTASVMVNDIPVIVDQDGSFTKTISVLSGATTIDIKAQNRFGKTTEIIRHITVK